MYYAIDEDANQFIRHEELTPAQRRKIVTKMRRQSHALAQHADALEVEGRLLAKMMPFVGGPR